MKKEFGQLLFSPTDLVRYFASPFASWMDRYNLENPGKIIPDEESDDQRLIAATGDQHEQTVLEELKATDSSLVEISKKDVAAARAQTIAAIAAKPPIIYQAAMAYEQFAGFADFLILDAYGGYLVWDTKLARSPKPYYAIQLCCYSEMLAGMTGERMPEKFGIILGNEARERVEFRVEDFIHFYRHIKESFLSMQRGFTGEFSERPEPLPRADHGRWSSHAEAFFTETDHLVRVAGISVGQIKKLKASGIATMTDLAQAAGRSIPKLAADSLAKLASQAQLQRLSMQDRVQNPDAPARYLVLPQATVNGKPVGLAALPPAHEADVFFDMEGYPLVAGGLEYLFGACVRAKDADGLEFKDWWAHDREEEKVAFEGFVDWIFEQWTANPGMHIFHYAPYEPSAVRRLSTRHDTRQDKVDQLLRNNVFVDLYQIVRQGLRIGEDSYSIKAVEHFYRPRRDTSVATAAESIVQYARWIESNQAQDWSQSPILKDIRDYNEDDCQSTAELLVWLRTQGDANNIRPLNFAAHPEVVPPPEIPVEAQARAEAAEILRQRNDEVSVVLADVLDFHRREEKPIWWRMFDRADAAPEELRDDPGCIEGVSAVGTPYQEKRSLIQNYSFDPAQECKLSARDDTQVMFSHDLDAKLRLNALDTEAGTLSIKIGKDRLDKQFGGKFPRQGSLIPYEYVQSKPIQAALEEVARQQIAGNLSPVTHALLNRLPPRALSASVCNTAVEAAVRVANAMDGECLVIQGPPGTGKTYTASQIILSLLAAGKTVGVTSNSHKAVVNLLKACGDALRASGRDLRGIKVGGDPEEAIFLDNRGLIHVESTKDGRAAYSGGVVGGTAWLFTLPEWDGALDFLFIDEAGQVSLANAVATARCANNLVLLGDQMQLEQPIQGSHPGDAGLSVLQYALKDTGASRPDAPVFHAVVPADYGIFLGESRRMHPAVCRFISESIYEGRLGSHPDCAQQKISVPVDGTPMINQEAGIVFSGVEHDGNIQQSDEEVQRVVAIYRDLLGRSYTSKDGNVRALSVTDFLFIAPYNAQVRSLQAALPDGARVGSVDKFQGQEAPVCIVSLCSSFGEYGSRGLAFILDRNRVNVAISRAQCLAVVVGDPRIAGATGSSIDEMALLNLYCKLAD